MKIYLLSCYRYVLSFIALRLVTNLFTNVFYRSLWLTDQKTVRHFLINTLGKQKCQLRAYLSFLKEQLAKKAQNQILHNLAMFASTVLNNKCFTKMKHARLWKNVIL